MELRPLPLPYLPLRWVYTRPLAALLVLCLLAWAGVRPAPAGAGDEPRFTPQKELVRPEGHREWIFIGATLGMSYSEDAPTHEPTFHNLYLKPAAYQEYKRTGRFPEKTIIVMETLSAGSQASINRQGHFEDRPVGLEAAVKDSSRFPEGWAYFNFTQGDGLAATARAFPKQLCWDCHHQHGATDNVFTQFYPVLRRASGGDGSHRR
ncbi:MAG TPA: cytochrome P460 family protein [Bryobacterales bacterium]|nr:cytochrome P460 family protein [Bryobacterales bacterium]